jgi:hypothetical protein
MDFQFFLKIDPTASGDGQRKGWKKEKIATKNTKGTRKSFAPSSLCSLCSLCSLWPICFL